MKLKTLDRSVTAATGMLLLGLIGCQDAIERTPDNPDSGPMMTVRLAKIKEAGDGGSGVELFHFSSGTLKKKVTTDGSEDSEPIVFSKSDDSRIYALIGHSIDVEEGKTGEDTFSRMTVVSPASAQSAPLFYSSVTTPESGSSQVDIKLTRSVGRIDIVDDASGLRITDARIDDAPGATYVFPVEGTVCESAPVSYVSSFPDGLSGTEKGVFMVYESSTPLGLTLSSASGESEIKVDLPAIARNKVYTVTLTKDDDVEDPGKEPVEVKPVVTVSDWEEDDLYSAPDFTTAILVDVEASRFPAGVRYDAVEGTLHVPYTGLENLDIAFSADIRVDVDTVMLRGVDIDIETEEPDEEEVIAFWWYDEDTGEWEWIVWGDESEPVEPRFTMQGNTTTARDKDVLTTYSMKIKPQTTGQREYSMTMSLRKASMKGVYDHLKIIVERHPKQIHTVKIGSREWMCFNATSDDIEEQIYPLDGLSVEEMYNEHFVDCVGNFFQYGKVNSFSPWTSNNPNAFADYIPNIPWENRDDMPLPKGFHVSTVADWRALMPNGVSLPGEWETPAGERIRGTVVTLPGNLETPSKAVNNRKYLMRYVVFESLDTGAKLYIPFVGYKGNSTAEVPDNVSTRGLYWLEENKAIQLINYNTLEDDAYSATIERNLWNANGFLPLRGVRNLPTTTSSK